MERQDAWAYGLVALDVAAMLLWLPLTASESFVLGPWFLLPHAVFVVLGCLGFWVFARADLNKRSQRPLLFLKWVSLLVIVGTAGFAWMAHSFYVAINEL